MKYSTLEEILNYIIKNNLKLTKNERKLLLKFQEPSYNDKIDGIAEISLKDFIKWYNSPLRQKEITKSLLTQNISKKYLESLLSLTSEDINTILEKYGTLDPTTLGYLTVSYARLRSYQKTSKHETNKDYPSELIDIIATDPDNCKRNGIVGLIENDILFARKDLVEKLVRNKDRKKFEVIYNHLEGFLDESKETQAIIARFFELELDDQNKERIYPWVYEVIERASRRPRAMEAVLRQDSPKKMNQVLFAASNNGIYRNRRLFNLIQNQEDVEKMANLREIGRYNRLRKYPKFLEWFATLDADKQRKLIKRIDEEEDKQKQEEREKRYQPIKEANEQIDSDILEFTSATTMKSAKKLVKTLNDSFAKYPKLKSSDTQKRD